MCPAVAAVAVRVLQFCFTRRYDGTLNRPPSPMIRVDAGRETPMATNERRIASLRSLEQDRKCLRAERWSPSVQAGLGTGRGNLRPVSHFRPLHFANAERNYAVMPPRDWIKKYWRFDPAL